MGLSTGTRRPFMSDGCGMGVEGEGVGGKGRGFDFLVSTWMVKLVLNSRRGKGSELTSLEGTRSAGMSRRRDGT